MGGVDVNDQKREDYGVGRSSKKLWKFIFHFVLNVCLVNCFILYDVINIPPSTPHGKRQLNFTRNAPSDEWYIQAGREVCPSELHSLTFIIRYKNTRPCKSVCFVYREKEKTSSGRGQERKYKCKQCDLPLYHVGCFLEYHQQRNVEVQN
jgi:hypothetical protein